MKLVMTFLLMSTLVACSRSGEAGKSYEPLYLEIYSVPDGFQQSVARIMNKSLAVFGDADPAARGNVAILPNGSLALIGTKNIHSGFKKLIEDLREVKAPTPRNITLECWMVLGGPGSASPADNLKELTPALTRISAGASLQFKLLEKLKISVMSGNQAQTSGRHFRMRPSLRESGNKILADLRITAGDLPGNEQNLSTQLYLDPGQFAVIGESQFNLIREFFPALESFEVDQVTLYYILRAGLD